LARDLDGLGAIGGFTTDGTIRAACEQRANSISHRFMVVDNEHTKRHKELWSLANQRFYFSPQEDIRANT
jgi:hypothetical protein